jgi:hypothetical protein
MKLSLYLTSEIRLRRWGQKAQANGPASMSVTGIHPESNPAELTTLRSSANRIRNEVTLYVLSWRGRTPGAGTHRKAYGAGLSQKRTPLCNEGDRLTDSRLMGR